jgi:hypothetical protein
MHFAPPTLVVRAGQPVELTLRNGGAIPHDFALAAGASGPVKLEAQGGQTARGTFTLETPGTYAVRLHRAGSRRRRHDGHDHRAVAPSPHRVPGEANRRVERVAVRALFQIGRPS